MPTDRAAAGLQRRRPLRLRAAPDRPGRTARRRRRRSSGPAGLVDDAMLLQAADVDNDVWPIAKDLRRNGRRSVGEVHRMVGADPVDHDGDGVFGLATDRAERRAQLPCACWRPADSQDILRNPAVVGPQQRQRIGWRAGSAAAAAALCWPRRRRRGTGQRQPARSCTDLRIGDRRNEGSSTLRRMFHRRASAPSKWRRAIRSPRLLRQSGGQIRADRRAPRSSAGPRQQA